MSSIQSYLTHYLTGLGASCWNAGIAALYATFGQAVGAGMVKDIPLPTIHEIGAIFIGAVALEALAYFKQNPIPVPSVTVTTTTATVAQKTTTT
jgi:hypothetical protein